MQSVDFLLADLGINREHILRAERGFSIHQEGPLDMRFDRKGADCIPAYECIRSSSP